MKAATTITDVMNTEKISADAVRQPAPPKAGLTKLVYTEAHTVVRLRDCC